MRGVVAIGNIAVDRIAGFAVYQWLQPVGPSWWTDLLGEGADLGLGATLPSFAVSVVLGLAVATLGQRRF